EGIRVPMVQRPVPWAKAAAASRAAPARGAAAKILKLSISLPSGVTFDCSQGSGRHGSLRKRTRIHWDFRPSFRKHRPESCTISLFKFPVFACKFPFPSQKFPFLFSREFHCKPLNLFACQRSKSRQAGVAGNLGLETGSTWTTCATNEPRQDLQRLRHF